MIELDLIKAIIDSCLTKDEYYCFSSYCTDKELYSKNNFVKIIKNLNLNTSELELIFNQDNIDFDYALANNPKVQSDFIRVLYEKYRQRNVYDILASIANNPNTHDEILKELISNEQPKVSVLNWYSSIIARRSDTSPDILDILSECNDCFSHIKETVALHLNTNSETLDKLSNSNSALVREYVSFNKNTASQTLDKLSNDNNVKVRSRLASVKFITPELINKLSEDVEPHVRGNIAKNSLTPLVVLQKLSNDKISVVIESVLCNKNTTSELIKSIYQNKFDLLKENRGFYNLAENPNTPSELLNTLVEMPLDWGVYMNIAGNPNTTEKTLAKLSTYENPFVLKYVIRNKNVTKDILDKLILSKIESVKFFANKKIKQLNLL